MSLKQRLPAVLVAVCVLALALAALARSPARAATSPYLGLVNMGMPTAPQPFMSDAFAITKHAHHTVNDANQNGYGPPSEGLGDAMTADHGSDCGPPPATHQINGNYPDSVFVCHDHLMTAGNAVGTGIISIQPNQLVDMSGGPAAVNINISTFRTSLRDWIDLYFIPWDEQTAYTNDGSTGEPLVDPPHDYILVHLDMTNGITYHVSESVGGVQRDVPGDDFTALTATGLVPSKSVRTPIMMTVSQDHFKLVVNNHTFYDAALPVHFPFTQTVFQFEHLNYDPAKDDMAAPAEQAALGLPAFANTWHWSNLAISSAVPYYQQMAMPDAVGDSSLPVAFGAPALGDTVRFAAAPAGSYLRYQGFDYHYTDFAAPAFGISFDGGKTWVPWVKMSGHGDGNEGSFLTPVPQGARSAMLRGGDSWYARDFYVMAKNGAVPPTATATAVPPTATPTATATAVATPTPVAINAVPCTVTLNGVTRSGTCSGTFTPSH